MYRRAVVVGVLVCVAVGACGDDSGSGGSSGEFGVPVQVGALTVEVSEPVRGTFPETIEVDVAFAVEDESEPVPVPDPVLTCDGVEYEIDHDAAVYPSEVDFESLPDASESGRWAWSPGPDCESGSFDVDGVTFRFDAVAPAE